MTRLGARESGTVLIVSMVLVMMAVGITGAFLFPSVAKHKEIESYYDGVRAEFAAASGASAAMRNINEYVYADPPLNTTFANAGSAAAPETLTYFVDDGSGGNLTPNDTIEWYGEIEDLTPTATKKTWRVIGVGRYRGQVRSVTVIIKRAYSSIYDNAVVGGAGASGGVINGNVALAGGLLVFGENKDGTGDVAPTDVVVSFSGTGGVMDDWSSMTPTLYNKVPTWPFDPKYPLKSEIRIKNGQVNLSGSGTLGEATNNSELFYGGNVGGSEGWNNVHTHKTGAYDLTDTFTMPDPDEPYTDPVTATVYATYWAYINANAWDVLAAVDIAALRNGAGASNDVKIDSDTPAFEAYDGANWGASTNRIRWNPATLVLEVDGLLHFKTTRLELSDKTDTNGFEYQGRASFWVDDGFGNGDIDIHGNILPVGTHTYPVTHVLGLSAVNDINVATGPGDSQLKMACVMYAVNDVVSRKQSEIAGTVFCNFFDLGGQVPSIYAIPHLKDYPPPGFLINVEVPGKVYRLNYLYGLPSDKRFDATNNFLVIDR